MVGLKFENRQIQGTHNLHPIQHRLFEVLHKGHHHDRLSRRVDFALSLLILINLCAIILESVPAIGHSYATWFFWIELVSVGLFTMEYGLRVWSAPARPDEESNQTGRARLRYITSFTGIVDLLSIIPTWLQWLIPGADLRWLKVIRMVRLLKLSHYSTALEDLFSAIYEERRAFGAALYLFAIALLLASVALHMTEKSVQPDAFGSIPEAMWWALITLTTVGYGDVAPVTALGKLIGSITALLGVCAVALLTGIVGSGFANQLARRQALFEAEVERALDDGYISRREASHIEHLRTEFNLPKEQAEAIIDSLVRLNKSGKK